MNSRAPSPGPTERHRQLRITARDCELLAFMAEHRLVLAAHVQVLLGISAGAAHARLRALAAAGFTRELRLFDRQPGCHLISRRGLAVIDSDLPPPRIDLRSYQHDVGVAWLWLAAKGRTFGPLSEFLGERRLRSLDASADRRDVAGSSPHATPDRRDAAGPCRPPPLAVRLGGVGPGGRERLHYPDLLLTTAGGHRIALELELSPKGRVRRETILAGYAADGRIDVVVYLTDSTAIARSIEASARRLGIASLVRVQRVRCTAQAPAGRESRAAERVHGRARADVHPAPAAMPEAIR